MNISFEREAYTNDNNLEYLKDRKYFAWIKYLRKNKWEEDKTTLIHKGQGVIVEKEEWVQFSSPNEETEYMAICTPVFQSIL